MSDPSETAIASPLDGTLFGDDSPCFGCGPSHPIGFRLAFTREDDRVCTRFTPGSQYQGPPGVMHGGLVTALADELAAWTVIAMKGRFGFTTTIEARLSRPVRVGVEVLGSSRITRDLQRVVEVETSLSQQGAVAYSAKFKFAVLDRAAAERLLGGPLPPRWAAFAR
jgi:acyl-coenzyme A thioesterase PaaI-like protein